MPKETIKEWKNRRSNTPALDVRWGNDFFDCIQVVVNRGERFVFIDKKGKVITDPDEPEFYTQLAITLFNEEDVDRLIKALQRAKRKTFS